MKSSDYHNSQKRKGAIDRIAESVNKSAEEVKKKIHTLRAQYSKEKTKMKTAKSGSGSQEMYVTKWEYFQALQFMFRHSENTTVDSMVSKVYKKYYILFNLI